MNAENRNVEQVKSLLDQARKAEANNHCVSAFELFQLALTLDPARASTAYRAARNLLDLGRITDAENLLKSNSVVPEKKRWVIELIFGQLSMAQFRPAEAEKHFKNAWALNASSTSPAIFLADCLIKQEKFDEASSVLLKALDVKGDHDEVCLNLGFVKRAQADYRTAQSYFLRAVAINPEHAGAKKALEDLESWLNFTD